MVPLYTVGEKGSVWGGCGVQLALCIGAIRPERSGRLPLSGILGIGMTVVEN